MSFLHPRRLQRCDRAREWVSLGLDGELSRFERSLLERHVASCAACAEFVRDVPVFTHALREAPLQPLERPVALPARRRLPIQALGFAAAAALAISVGAGALSSSLGEERTARPAVRAIPVDEGVDRLKARQFVVLTEQVTFARPPIVPPGPQLA